MIIDSSNAILGRLASRVAKELLKGEQVVVVNCENIIVSGNKKDIFKKYLLRRKRGDPHKGPFYPRYSDRIFHRAVRGMLPKNKRGREAIKKLRAHIGCPEKYKNLQKLGKSSNDLTCKYITLKQISRHLGAKV